MKTFEFASEIDPAIGRACASFVTQVRALASVYGVAVVLLDESRVSSRVVFSWKEPHELDNGWDSYPVSSGPAEQPESPATCIILKGSEGILGAALVRGRPNLGWGTVDLDLARKYAEHLAARLENTLLQQRLDRGAQERAAFDRLGKLAGSSDSVERVYQEFANEIKNLVEYQRLTVFLADQGADLLTCVFRAGKAAQSGQPKMTRTLSGSGCELVVSGGEICLVDGLGQSIEAGWPELSGVHSLRSAVVVPVVYGGSTVGVVALENRLPDAYCPDDANLLLRVAALLGPSIRNSILYTEIGERDQETAVANEIAQILASRRRLEEVFGGFTSAASKLVDFDLITLAWLDPNGSDILTLRAGPGPIKSASADLAGDGSIANIHARLQFAEGQIGTLTLWRGNDVAFTSREAEVLQMLGIQVSSAVQYDRLYRLSRRQAYQLDQLNRAPQSDDQNSALGGITQVMVDQAARMLGARFGALYLYRDDQVASVMVSRRSSGPEEITDPFSPELVTMAGNCFLTGQRQAIGNLSNETIPMGGGVSRISDNSAYLALPLPWSTGSAGVLVLGRSNSSPWLPAEVELIEAFTNEIAKLVTKPDAVRDQGELESRPLPDALGRELLVDAAHALRTPLSSIKGYSSTLLQPDLAWPPELHQEFLETIDREADHLNRTINDLLGSTQSESGTVRIDRSVAEVNRLLQMAEAELSAGGRRRPFRFVCEPDLPAVVADQARMVQVIVYLARCADQVSAHGAVVLVHAYLKSDRIRIRVGSTSEAETELATHDVSSPLTSSRMEFFSDWVDSDLMLTVCNTLLSSHGVDLEIGPPGARDEMFWFDLPVMHPQQRDAVTGS